MYKVGTQYFIHYSVLSNKIEVRSQSTTNHNITIEEQTKKGNLVIAMPFTELDFNLVLLVVSLVALNVKQLCHP